MIPPLLWGLSGTLFCLGFACMILRRQLLAMVLGLELMINAANLNILCYAARWQDPRAMAVALLVIAVAAAEAVVGFALILALHRRHLVHETEELRELIG